MGYKSRQVFYNRKQTLEKNKIEEAIIIELANSVRRTRPRTGTKKLYEEIKPIIQSKGLKYGRDKVHKTLKKNDLIIKPSKKYTVTTDSKHFFRKYKNLIKNLELIRPEQVFVNDITYIRIKDKFAYLFLVTDAYSKKIMGWSINYTMKVKDGIKAIKMTCKNRRFKTQVIHHSDRGIQYCTPSYINFIAQKNMIPSMTQHAHVYENAIAERVNGILKSEFGIGNGFNSLKEARAVIANSIFIYNNQRKHMSLHNLTPNFVHLNPGIKIKSWKSKRKFNKKNQQNS